MSRISNLFIAVIVACISGAHTYAAEKGAASGQVKFLTGGVGEDSEAHMQAISKQFNLRLLFAAKDGHYLADVAVTITDTFGARILDTVAKGPWLLATLAAGTHTIDATYAGSTVSRSTTIAGSGRREVFFRWEEPQFSTGADGKTK